MVTVYLLVCLRPGDKYEVYSTLAFTTLWAYSADDKLWIFFLILFPPRKWALTFHANCLWWRQFAWNVKVEFLGKNMRNIPRCHLLKFISSMLSIRTDMVSNIAVIDLWNELVETIEANKTLVERQRMLTLCMLGKNFSRQHFELYFLFFLENRIWHFMLIVS